MKVRVLSTVLMEILFLGGIILVALILFVTELFPIDVTALLVLGLLLILGLVSPSESLQGFSNPAVITIACLFILSHALQKSHILESVSYTHLTLPTNREV